MNWGGMFNKAVFNLAVRTFLLYGVVCEVNICAEFTCGVYIVCF